MYIARQAAHSTPTNHGAGGVTITHGGIISYLSPQAANIIIISRYVAGAVRIRYVDGVDPAHQAANPFFTTHSAGAVAISNDGLIIIPIKSQ
jgi:hypothetical protein